MIKLLPWLRENALEIILIFSGLLIIGFTGWYVTQATNNAKQAYENSANLPVAIKVKKPEVSQSVPQPIISSPTTSTPTTKKPAAAPSPTPAPDPHAVVHPTLVNCTQGTFNAYFYKTGGTNGYASTGQSLPGDNTHKDVYYPDSYLNPPVNPIQVNCVKDTNDKYIDGWVSTYVYRGNTYLKMEDLTLNPPK